MQKKAGRYIRFSSEDQSANSTERQDTITYLWCERNNVEIIATFKDEGHSARTFDRPDVIQLFKFIENNKGRIDYLVVQDLSRFSREDSEAIAMVKKIQLQSGVKIVSCDSNQIFDVRDAQSRFMMAIEFARATADNLSRISYTNGGIYTAKTGVRGRRTGEERGRYIGGSKPFGYHRIEENGLVNIAITEDLRKVVETIFSDYLAGVPITAILQYARKHGYHAKGKCVIQKLLSNPVYKGEQYVKAWKDMEGGMFRGSWEPIIDNITWQRANDKLKGNKVKGITISDKYYLKGVAHCWCGCKLTGADSKGRNGYYPYYKCNHSKHLNINADYAHAQLQEVLKHLSLPDYLAMTIKESYLQEMEVALLENKKLLSKYKMQLAESREKLLKVEEKFINDHIPADAYKRWNAHYSNDIRNLQHSIDDISHSDTQISLLTDDNLERLTDIPYMLSGAAMTQKQSFLNMVFDNRLYIKEKIYRTGYLMEIFKHNSLILKQKKLLIIDEKRASVEKPLEGSQAVPLSNRLLNLLSIIESIEVA